MLTIKTWLFVVLGAVTVLCLWTGMNPKAAFPIMMGRCAFLLPTGSTRFIVKERYDLLEGLGLALGGIPAVLLAAFIVKSRDLYYVRWLVVLVVIDTALSLLRSALAAPNSDNPQLSEV